MRNLKREAACEYCDGNEKLYYAEDRLMRQAKIDIIDNVLCIDLFSDYVSFPINFCPMCRRKLNEES